MTDFILIMFSQVNLKLTVHQKEAIVEIPTTAQITMLFTTNVQVAMTTNAVLVCHSRNLNVRKRVGLVLTNVGVKEKFSMVSVPVSQTALSAVRKEIPVLQPILRPQALRKNVKNQVEVMEAVSPMEREMQSPTAQVVTIQTATMESVLSHALVEEEIITMEEVGATIIITI